MKIKYRLISILLPVHVLWLFISVKFFIGLYDILNVLFIVLFVVFILFEVNFILYIFFGVRIIIKDKTVVSKLYFIQKRLDIEKNTEVIIKPIFGFLRKRLLIKTGKKMVVFWDFYSTSLDSIAEGINKKIDEMN